MRVPAEDRRQVQQVIDGRTYTARDGFFDMPDGHARAHLKSAGYGRWHVPGIANKRSGYMCTACGFRGFFRICGRCDSPATRTGEIENA